MNGARLTIDIVADPVCPWCYVGLRSFLAARSVLANDFNVEARIRPYQLNPGLPIEGVDRRAYYAQKFPDAERLAAARAAIRENARLSGFDFDPAAPAQLPNTVKAHQIIRLALFSGKQEEVALAVYKAFWDEMKDIGDDETLIAIAAEAGLNKGLASAALASPEDAAMVEAEADALRRAGVSGVPTFIVNEHTGFSGGMPPGQLAAALRRAAVVTQGERA